jgi:hypothetical protein
VDIVTDDLVAFLRAREAEREQVARRARATRVHDSARKQHWHANGHAIRDMDGHLVTGRQARSAEAAHIARHDPAWVLADVEAKRRIIDRYKFVDNHGAAVDHVRALDMSTGARAALLDVVKMLALPYAQHPDYRQEWTL